MPSPFTLPSAIGSLRPSAQRANVASVETAWWTYPAATPDADTIVAVHGFRGDHHGLEPFVACDPDHTWVVPDLPGFGETGSWRERSLDLDAYVDWLSQFVANVRPQRGKLFLLGHSFGSIVVAHAVARGLSVDATILVNPISAPALSGPRALLTAAAIAYYRIGAVLPERLGRAWLSNSLVVRAMGAAMAKRPDRKVRMFVHQQHLQYFSRFANRQALLEAFRTSVSHSVRDAAPDMPGPVLFIAAERDDITSVEDQVITVALAPNAHLAVIPRVGHLIHYETPAVAVEHLRAFVTNQ